MKKVIKIVTWVLVLFISVCGLALAALYTFADPNKLKPIITNEVMKRTGYQLVIDGDLTWSLYPQIGVKAQHLTLTAPNQKKPFVDLKRVNIAVEPTQLLFGASKVRGEVHIADAVLMNVHMTSALVVMHWEDGMINVRPIQASLYGGSLSGNARGKDFSSVPAWNWDVSLSHIDMLPFLIDANGADVKLKLSGMGQLRINASTRGVNSQQMQANLNGATDFSIANGKVAGVDLNYLIKSADALLHKQNIEGQESTHATAFDSLAGSVLINNGVAQTNNLTLIASAFKVNGQGQYSLPARTIDLALQVRLQEESKSQWQLPVLIRGAIANPDIKLDTNEINKQIAANELAKVKDKVRDQIKEKIPGKAGEFLQNLIGN